MHNINARPFPFSQQPAPLMWPLPAAAASGGWPFLATWAQLCTTTGRGEAGSAAGGGEGLGLPLHVINTASLFTILFCPFYVTFTFPPCFPFDCSILLHYLTMGIRSRTPLPYLSSMQWRYQTKLACVDSLTTLPALHTSLP